MNETENNEISYEQAKAIEERVFSALSIHDGITYRVAFEKTNVNITLTRNDLSVKTSLPAVEIGSAKFDIITSVVSGMVGALEKAEANRQMKGN